MATPWDINARTTDAMNRRHLLTLQQAFGMEDAALQQQHALSRMQKAKELDLQYSPEIEAAIYGAREPFAIRTEGRAEERDVRSDERDVGNRRKIKENELDVEMDAYSTDPARYVKMKRGKDGVIDDGNVYIPFADEFGGSNQETAEEARKTMPNPDDYEIILGKNPSDKNKAAWVIKKKTRISNAHTATGGQPAENPEEVLRKKQQLLEAAQRSKRFYVEE